MLDVDDPRTKQFDGFFHKRVLSGMRERLSRLLRNYFMPPLGAPGVRPGRRGVRHWRRYFVGWIIRVHHNLDLASQHAPACGEDQGHARDR